MAKRGWVSWERVRPLPKGWKRNVCEWVPGIGWVYNPTHRKWE